MKYPCLVLKSVCTTPITITVYQEGLSEDGEPLKALEINALCNYQDKAKTSLKYFSPDQDQQGDSHVFKYRNNNLYAHCYENKLAGIYCSYVE